MIMIKWAWWPGQLDLVAQIPAGATYVDNTMNRTARGNLTVNRWLTEVGTITLDLKECLEGAAERFDISGQD